jgi:hypothetical protein
MKTLKRVLAIGVVAAVASVGFATTAGADHTEARLTLTIDPTVGPPGQVINAQLPPEAYDPAAGDLCAASATANQLIAEAFADFASGLPPEQVLQNLVANILEAAAEDPEFAGTLDSILFPLIFADPVTQEPLADPAFWDPDTGQGSIVAPGEDVNTGEPLARPSLYAVAGTCLGINPDLLPDAVAAAVESLVTIIEEGEAAALAALVACLTADPTDPTCVPTFLAATAETIEEGVPQVLGALLEATIDQDPDIAWAALFCLTGENFETCDAPPDAGPGPAAPVQVTPRFTG